MRVASIILAGILFATIFFAANFGVGIDHDGYVTIGQVHGE